MDYTDLIKDTIHKSDFIKQVVMINQQESLGISYVLNAYHDHLR